VIFKDLPVLQCENRSEYLLQDEVMAKVNDMLSRGNAEAELEILSYAACPPQTAR
jgi:hypothetical protein